MSNVLSSGVIYNSKNYSMNELTVVKINNSPAGSLVIANKPGAPPPMTANVAYVPAVDALKTYLNGTGLIYDDNLGVISNFKIGSLYKITLDILFTGTLDSSVAISSSISVVIGLRFAGTNAPAYKIIGSFDKLQDDITTQSKTCQFSGNMLVGANGAQINIEDTTILLTTVTPGVGRTIGISYAIKQIY